MRWKETTPDFMQFTEKGQSLEGKLLGYTDIKVKEVVVKRWKIERLDDGIVMGFLGGVSLDDMLLAVPVNTIIKLEYQGKVKIASGYQVKQFKLYFYDDTEDTESDEPSKPRRSTR